MCVGMPSIAFCACGASFPACDFVEMMTHITPNSSPSHRWVQLETGPFAAGRLISDDQPKDYKKFIAWKYSDATAKRFGWSNKQGWKK